jgi:hypothetical protein
MVGTTVWMMVTDRIARGGTGRLGAVRSLAWAVEASRAWARVLKKDDGVHWVGAWLRRRNGMDGVLCCFSAGFGSSC